MHTIVETSLRTIIGFTVLLILTRLLGKKLLGQLTFFTYITGIAMGNIAGDMVVHRDIKLVDGVSGLIIWAFLTFVVEFVSLKSSKARVLLDGEPAIVIKKDMQIQPESRIYLPTEIIVDGKVVKKNLKELNLNNEWVDQQLKHAGVNSVEEVFFAELQSDGSLHISKKTNSIPLSQNLH